MIPFVERWNTFINWAWYEKSFLAMMCRVAFALTLFLLGLGILFAGFVSVVLVGIHIGVWAAIPYGFLVVVAVISALMHYMD